MAGIYIHIPFCKQACHYCDFHFSISTKYKELFLKSLNKEIYLQKKYLENEVIKTIYLGGGTPSMLSQSELGFIFDTLYKTFEIANDAEITLEANPDDLTKNKINELNALPINRLSIGIQSFDDQDLKLMNRAHTSSEALRSVLLAQDKGLDNITIDLMYGLPTLSNQNWKNNLRKAFELNVNHISAYCLTIEPKTALADFIKKGKINNVDEQQSSEQFEIMLDEMNTAGFIQYEISNFCKNNFYSKHNSNYWLKENYLGLGPSAHSFNGTSRQWNVSNNHLYIQSLEKNQLNFEMENLTTAQQYNEYVLTSLRTMWGTDLNYIKQNLGEDFFDYCLNEVEKYIKTNKISRKENKLFLTNQGKLIADKIASDLFKIE